MPATGVALACGLLGGSAAVVVLCYAPAKAAAAEIGMSAAGSTGIVPSAEVQHLRLIGNVDSGVPHPVAYGYSAYRAYGKHRCLAMPWYAVVRVQGGIAMLPGCWRCSVGVSRVELSPSCRRCPLGSAGVR